MVFGSGDLVRLDTGEVILIDECCGPFVVCEGGHAYSVESIVEHVEDEDYEL